jgi:phage-related baseplate assembly protein
VASNLTIDWRALVGAKDRDEVVDFMTTKLAELGSIITNYNVGGVWRTWLEVVGEAAAQLYNLAAGYADEATGTFVPGVVQQGFAEFATGDWLDLHLNDFGLEREPSSFARHRVKVTVSSPVTVPKYRTVITELNPAGDVFRFYVEEETLISPPFGYVECIAQVAGAAYNVGAGSIIMFEQPLANVTDVTNESDSIIDAGTNRETDARARERRRLAWSRLSAAGPTRSYEGWVFDASEDVVGVSIINDHPRGAGSVDAVVQSVAGIPSDELIATVQAYVELWKPLTADFLAIKPTAVSVDIVATLYCHPDTPDLTVIEDEAERRLEAHFIPDPDLNLDEGGDDEDDDEDGGDPGPGGGEGEGDEDDGEDDDEAQYRVPLRKVGEDLYYMTIGDILAGTTGARRLVRNVKVWDAGAGEPTLFADVTVPRDGLTVLNSVSITAVRLESL